MIELEKSNSVLREQVNHLKEELEKVVKIKLEKAGFSYIFNKTGKAWNSKQVFHFK